MTLLMRDQENMEKGTLQERRKIIIKMIGLGFNDRKSCLFVKPMKRR